MGRKLPGETEWARDGLATVRSDAHGIHAERISCCKPRTGFAQAALCRPAGVTLPNGVPPSPSGRTIGYETPDMSDARDGRL